MKRRNPNPSPIIGASYTMRLSPTVLAHVRVTDIDPDGTVWVDDLDEQNAGHVSAAQWRAAKTRRIWTPPRVKAPGRKRNPKAESRATKAVRRVTEAFKAGVLLHWRGRTADGRRDDQGTAGYYRSGGKASHSTGIAAFAILGTPGRGGRDATFDTAFGAADHLVEWIGVGNAIDALKAAARKHGAEYANLDTPIRWTAKANPRRRNPDEYWKAPPSDAHPAYKGSESMDYNWWVTHYAPESVRAERRAKELAAMPKYIPTEAELRQAERDEADYGRKLRAGMRREEAAWRAPAVKAPGRKRNPRDIGNVTNAVHQRVITAYANGGIRDAAKVLKVGRDCQPGDSVGEARRILKSYGIAVAVKNPAPKRNPAKKAPAGWPVQVVEVHTGYDYDALSGPFMETDRAGIVLIDGRTVNVPPVTWVRYRAPGVKYVGTRQVYAEDSMPWRSGPPPRVGDTITVARYPKFPTR